MMVGYYCIFEASFYLLLSLSVDCEIIVGFLCTGRLQEGDQILEVNSLSLERVTNDEYVSFICKNTYSI